MNNPKLRVLCITALTELREDVREIISSLNLFVGCESDADVKIIIQGFEDFADRFGPGIFRDDDILQLVEVGNDGSYSAKIFAAWALSKMIEKGSMEFHSFLVENGIFGLIGNVLCSTEDFQLMRVLLRCWIVLMSNTGLYHCGDEVLERIEELSISVDRELGDLAHIVCEMIKRQKCDES
jgi:hypothetical protein